MLRASIIGNLGGDPEVRYTQNGEALVTISVAVNQRKRIPDSEEWKESTTWFRVRCPGWRGDLAQKLGKGQRVYVCGRMEINEYVRRDGTPGVSHDIWADELHGMNPPSRNEASNGSRAPVSASIPTQPDTGSALDDLPF